MPDIFDTLAPDAEAAPDVFDAIAPDTPEPTLMQRIGAALGAVHSPAQTDAADARMGIAGLGALKDDYFARLNAATAERGPAVGPTQGSVPAGGLPNLVALRAGRLESAGVDPAVTAFAETPIVQLPRMEPREDDSRFDAAAKATVNTLGSTASSFTSPEMIGLGGAGAVQGLARPIAGLFGGQMLSSIPEAWRAVKEAEKTPAFSQARWEAGLNMLTLGVFSHAALGHFLKGEAPAAQAQGSRQRPEELQPQDPRLPSPEKSRQNNIPVEPMEEPSVVPSLESIRESSQPESAPPAEISKPDVFDEVSAEVESRESSARPEEAENERQRNRPSREESELSPDQTDYAQTADAPREEASRPQARQAESRGPSSEANDPTAERQAREAHERESQPQAGFVRLYHRASKGVGQAGRDFTPFRDYAQGYADKAGDGTGGQVWYVDVPEGSLKTHDEYGQPLSRVIVPDEIADRARPLSNEAASVGQPPTRTEAPELQSASTQEPPPTSTKNEATTQERESRGIAPAEEAARRDFGTVWDEAREIAAKDAEAPRRLVESLQAKPRALTDQENALLLHRQIEVQNEHDAAIRAVNERPDDATARERLDRVRDDLQETYDTAKLVGTETGRGLNARKMLANADFSLAKMEAETRAVVNKGKPLSRDQIEQVKQLHERIAAAEAKIAAYEARPRNIRNVARQQARAGRTFNEFLAEQATNARQRQQARRPAAKVSLSRQGTDVDPHTSARYSLPRETREAFVETPDKSEDLGLQAIARKLGDGGTAPRLSKMLPPRRAANLSATSSIAGVARLARRSGTEVVWFKADRPTGINGAAFGRKLYINVDSVTDPLHMLAGHEVWHTIQKSDPTLARSVKNAIKLNTEAFRDYRAALLRKGYAKGEIKEEFLADVFGEAMTDPVRFHDAIGSSLAKRVLVRMQQWINNALRFLTGREKETPQFESASAAVRNLEEIRSRIIEVLRDGTASGSPLSGEARFKRQGETPSDDLLIGADHIAKGAQTFEQWAELMRNEGSSPTPELFTQAKKYHDDIASAFRTPEQQRLDRLKAGTIKRTEELRGKLEAGDFSKKERNVTTPDKELIDLRYEREKAKEDYHRGLIEAKLRDRTPTQKVIGGVGEVFNTTRALMTSFDLSAVLRQGGFIAVGHPLRAAKAFGPMFRALASERGQFRVMEEIRNRPNAPLYKQAKLYISDEGAGASLSKMEEAYASRWAKKIPGLGASERAYTTFLNKLRADSFDAMTASLAKRGKPTLEEAKAIANFVNVATGRGDMGQHATAAATLNKAFFAPRYVLSRFQLLTGQPLYRGSLRTRAMVAGEYAKMLAGMAVIYSLAASAGDDKVELDPRSSDFLKIRFGNARLDPLFGLIQTTTLLTRLASGTTKNAKGAIVPIRGNLPFGATTSVDVISRFLRSKLAPIPGALVTLAQGRNAVGDPVTALPQKASFDSVQKSVVGNTVLPIAFGDIANAMQSQGIARGTALATLSLFGMGLQNYDAAAKKAHPVKLKHKGGPKPFDLNDAIRERKMSDIGASLARP